MAEMQGRKRAGGEGGSGDESTVVGAKCLIDGCLIERNSTCM